MSKAVIYVRVSSSRQVDNTSLESQEAACREWCRQQKLQVAHVFVERGESAKTADRTEFQHMFRYLEQSSGITHLVVDKFDRFSRSMDDGAEYRLRLRRLNVVLCSAKEPTDNTPAGRLFANVLGSFAQFDNDVRSHRAQDGMKASLKAGRWVWMAPIGYVHGNSKQEPSLTTDPERGPLMFKLFELVASGQKKADALAHVTALGLRTRAGRPLSQGTLAKLLKNPLYWGRIEKPEWGVFTKGDFQPLVSEGLFDRVQRVLSGRALPSVPHRRENERFPLKGLLLCPECGLPATGSTSKGKTKRFSYYHCHRGTGHFRAPSQSVEDEFLALLESLQPNPDRMRLIEEIFRRVWADKQSTVEADIQRLRDTLAKNKARKERLLDGLESGALESDDFKRRCDQVNADIADSESRLAIAEDMTLDIESALSYLIHLFWNSRIFWEQSDLAGKRRLGMAIFPEGLTFSNSGFGTPLTHSIFKLLADESVEEREVVRPERFELPTY